MLSFLLRGHRSGDVSRPQLQPHLLPQHLAVHRRSTRSSLSPATVQSKHSSLAVVTTGNESNPAQTGPHRFPTQVLMDLACFEPLRRLVCGMFLPQCSPQGGVLQPCRSVCSSAEQQCSQALDLFSFSWPFNCHLLPDLQDPTECSLP